jgi:DNA-3-methyladenine glycosylase I
MGGIRHRMGSLVRLGQMMTAALRMRGREVTIKRMHRCPWAKSELMAAYHDTEWGVPVHDDRTLFEFLILEGAQAGLSWETVLKKREAYRAAFDDFNAEAIARFNARTSAALMANPGIIRNRLKIAAAMQNAKAFNQIRGEFGDFNSFIWRFVNDKPIRNRRRSMADIPSRNEQSDAMSKELKRRGFKFVGTTICYAFMQAVGMANDHLVSCPRHREIAARYA